MLEYLAIKQMWFHHGVSKLMRIKKMGVLGEKVEVLLGVSKLEGLRGTTEEVKTKATDGVHLKLLVEIKGAEIGGRKRKMIRIIKTHGRGRKHLMGVVDQVGEEEEVTNEVVVVLEGEDHMVRICHLDGQMKVMVLHLGLKKKVQAGVGEAQRDPGAKVEWILQGSGVKVDMRAVIKEAVGTNPNLLVLMEDLGIDKMEDLPGVNQLEDLGMVLEVTLATRTRKLISHVPGGTTKVQRVTGLNPRTPGRKRRGIQELVDGAKVNLVATIKLTAGTSQRCLLEGLHGTNKLKTFQGMNKQEILQELEMTSGMIRLETSINHLPVPHHGERTNSQVMLRAAGKTLRNLVTLEMQILVQMR